MNRLPMSPSPSGVVVMLIGLTLIPVGIDYADGVMSAVAALWSAFPNTSYSQNVGLVSFTGVASRHVTAITGGLTALVLNLLLPNDRTARGD
jgi:xanthine/uracil permease